jgi:hypothetical protein
MFPIKALTLLVVRCLVGFRDWTLYAQDSKVRKIVYGEMSLVLYSNGALLLYYLLGRRRAGGKNFQWNLAWGSSLSLSVVLGPDRLPHLIT